jgi:hypothetical protein
MGGFPSNIGIEKEDFWFLLDDFLEEGLYFLHGEIFEFP